MSLFPCFVLFTAVYGTVAFESFDSFRMELLFKELVNENLLPWDFQISKSIQKYIPCNAGKNRALDFFSCYKNMRNHYATIEKQVVLDIIKKHVMHMIEQHNGFVWSYMKKLKTERDVAQVKLTTIRSISFKSSKLYCVAEFFKTFSDNNLANNLLNDFFYYYQFETVPKMNEKKVFYKHLDVMFKNCTLPIVAHPVGGFDRVLLTSKTNINAFSEPFCKLQYNLYPNNEYGAKFLWTALQTSSLLPTVIIDGQDLYNYKGLQENTTLKEVFDKTDRVTGYKATLEHYTTVRNIINMYVVKVLTRKIVNAITNAMRLYYDDVSSLDLSKPEDKITFEDRKSTQFYVLQIFLTFNLSIGLYYTTFSTGIKSDDDKFVVNTMNTIRVNFWQHTFSKTAMDPKPKIDLINKQLDYVGSNLTPDASQNSADHNSGTNYNNLSLDDLITEIEKLNYLITYLVEVKRDA